MPGNAKPVRDARRGRFLRPARQSPGVVALQQVSPLSVDTLSEAELIEVATRQSTDDPDSPASHKAMHRLNLDHPGATRAWLLIVLASVFDSHVRFSSG